MDLTDWIVSQPAKIKLIVGVIVGTITYVGFRTLVYFANKGWKKKSEGKNFKPVPIWEQDNSN